MIKDIQPANSPIYSPANIRKSSKKDWYGTQDQQHTKPKKKRKEWEKMKDEQRHNETSAFIFASFEKSGGISK